MEQQNSHLLLMGNAKSGAMLEIVWKFLIKLNMFLPLIQITLFGFYQNELKSYIHT